MKPQQIGTRGILFTFYELNDYPTSVFVIIGKSHFFICDTFLGPLAMDGVKKYLRLNYGDNPFIVFNSHHHWDHIWGNCAFPESLIIAHEACRETIQKEGASELERNGELRMGDVKLVLPTLTFKDSIHFPDEGLLFSHSPGHTEDSSSCFDEMEKTLFVGDNVEAPIPYLAHKDLHIYVKTLEEYLEMDSKTIIAGHGGVIEESLIERNVAYVEAFMRNDMELYEKGACEEVHRMNNQAWKEMMKKK